MKIKEVLFVIGVFTVGIQAANFYSLVDIQNDEIELETPEVVPLTLDVVLEATEEQGIEFKKTKKVKPDNEYFEETITNDQKNLFKDVKLELLELQKMAILDQLHALEEKNKMLQEELDAKTKLQEELDAKIKLQELLDARTSRYQTKKQKPARVQLEQNSQNSDNDMGFWDWLCFVTKNLALKVLNFFGVHV